MRVTNLVVDHDQQLVLFTWVPDPGEDFRECLDVVKGLLAPWKRRWLPEERCWAIETEGLSWLILLGGRELVEAYWHGGNDGDALG